MVIAPVAGLDENDAGRWQVSMPDGRTQAISVSSRMPLVFNDTQLVGAYWFRRVGTGEKREAGEGEMREGEMGEGEDRFNTGETPMIQVRVVEVPAAESTLRGVAPELLAECAERLRADRFGDVGSLVAATTRDRFGVEIWRPLLWLLLAVMVGEVLWQQLGGTRSANRFAPPRPKVTT